MGSMKDWGLRIAEAIYDRGLSVDDVVRANLHQVVSVLDVKWQLVHEGKLTKLIPIPPIRLELRILKEIELDPQFVTEQVQSVHDHPEMWGHSPNYWENLRRVRSVVREVWKKDRGAKGKAPYRGVDTPPEEV